MDRAQLAARIQEILKTPRTPPRGPLAVEVRRTCQDEEAEFAARCEADGRAADLVDVLGGGVETGAGGSCVVVDRWFPASFRHGHHLVEHLAAAARRAPASLPWFLRSGTGSAPGPSLLTDPAAEPHLLFFDLETTGLAGGAGTYAFLVGFAAFDGDAFQTRQLFLRGYGEERALLHAVAGHLDASGGGNRRPVIVTYNGRAFDIPLIETRYSLNRLAMPFGELPHVDMLCPARRLWKRRLRGEEPNGSCALTAIERDILGFHRQDDVPGWEIPTRYFAYARTGDACGLVSVFEHNRLDLLSLAAVTSLVLDMVGEGAESIRDRHDCLALARLFEYLGRTSEAERCYAAAADDDGLLETTIDRQVRAEALHWLALQRRRARRFEEAAEAWRALASIAGLDLPRRREALEALAIHHEHRVRDLEAARDFAWRALDAADDVRRVDEMRRRLGRLSRKLSAASHPIARPLSPPQEEGPA